MTDAGVPSSSSVTCPRSGKDAVAVTPCFAECCDPSELLGLSGRKGLVIGIANGRSLASPAAMHFRQAGAELAIAYGNKRTRPHVEPLARRLEAPIVLPRDLAVPDQLEAVCAGISERWGRLDFLLHAISSVPLADLHSRLIDSLAEGFAKAETVSVHSLIRMARLAEPLMTKGDSILTLNYLGAEPVVENYNVMVPVKAALEGSVRYPAHELSPGEIRVNAISAGPTQTRTAFELTNFGVLLSASASVAPWRCSISGDEVSSAIMLLRHW
ncbi:Enoyl-[acyl-carrier-protein] reductase [NADH] (plasmid) [Tritonibacter mobilis]|uniref:SDR family oxidoreductase n=1 Tax=Tritonibacter mobilis TaxID=379347 RepID=UPI00089857B1|nr:SDR family oxidoreductase [Tritonibacter mobilis]GLP88237.1 enoyl-[acyl-carrier-protein] reductase [NADH] [Tritonibacter mobilis]SDX99343.1 Enoyl-[acyl-carrier-protein] reductase [NADH] [Tritonibacter mobilis]VCU62308.1 Enoyl-[acyl-carrier-protein] reductase [NADH] [Tritonibacter mobilis]